MLGRVSRFFAALTAAVLTLSLGPFASGLGSDSDQRDSDEFGIPVVAHVMASFEDSFAPLMVEYSDVYAGHVFDVPRSTVTIHTFAADAGSRAEAFEFAIASLNFSDELNIRLVADARVSASELFDVSDDIRANPTKWAGLLGAPPLTSLPNVREATITVGVDDAMLDGTVVTLASHPKIRFVLTRDYPRLQLQGRTNDTSPWTGGNLLVSRPGYFSCTQGFTWWIWATGENVGSTANHCFDQEWRTGGSTGTTALGTKIAGGVGPDTMLLRAAPGTSFAPTVWLVSNGVHVERVVKGVQGSGTLGQVAVLSAAASNWSPVATVMQVNLSVGIVGPMSVVDWTGCLDGDSGGPWLTTYSNGTVRAQGQHVGLVVDSLGDPIGCAYMNLNPISAALEASIRTG